ncbi:MAG: hypothetical protein MUE52_04430 [Tabrizicola sp.]|jgi:hypothetical protein|nr:hypothetical protein [Tabrizicola sp.]
MSRQPKPKAAAPAPAPKTSTAAAAPVTPDPAKQLPQVAQDPTGAVSAPASAAAEAAAAPVDPIQPTGPGASPEDAKDPDGNPPSPDAPRPTGFVLRVKGPATGRWRIGRHFTPEIVDIPAEDLTHEEIAALNSDPQLTVLALGED